jgi:hypothetical protein
MLRATSALLFRLPQRASLALAHPLLAAFAPCYAPKLTRDVSGLAARDLPFSTAPLLTPSTTTLPRPSSICFQLNVFARTPHTDHANVEVAGDSVSVAVLKDAVIAKLQLDTAPHRVRLLREVEGGAAVHLDSRKNLVHQGVLEGSSLLVEVLAPAAASAAECAALEGGRRLLAALRAAELEPIPASRSSLIRLPQGALWPQLGAEPLFVRDFYCGLYEGPLASCDPGCATNRPHIKKPGKSDNRK